MRSCRIRQGRAVLLVALIAVVPVLAGGSLATAQAPAQASPAVSATLPPAREILDRHVKAIGGREALLARSSSRATGTFSMPAAGISGTLEVFAAKPNKTLMRMTLPGVGELQEGFDGTIGWSISPMTGASLIEGKQLEQRKSDSDFHGDLNPESRYESMTTVEQTTFDGRPCYKVRLVRRGGGEDFQFYDVATGLRAGSITTRESPMGTITATAVETDYKSFGKVLQATKVTLNMMTLQQVMTIDSVEYDKVDPSTFEPPAQIKALIK